MLEKMFGNLSFNQILLALALVAAFIILAWLARFLIVKYIKNFAAKTKNHLDDVVLAAIQKPLVIIIVLAGLYIGVLTLPRDVDFWFYTLRVLAILLSLMGIYTAAALINAAIKWYKMDVAVNIKNVGFSVKLLNVFLVIVILAAIWLAVIAVLGIWGLKVTAVTDWLGEHGWRIALIIGVAMLLVIAAGEIVPRIVISTLSRRPDESDDEVKKRSDTLSKVLVSTTQIFVFLIAAFMVVSELNIEIAPILASAGVVGVALGFGAQSLVKDILAGLFIILESQYRVGDVVRVAGVSGVVESINLRRTVLRDIDGIVHTVPNGEIRVASNFTKEMSRVNLDISVGYGEDLERVMAVINKVGKNLAEDPKWKPFIIKPPQALRVNNFGASGIEIKIIGDTQPMKQWEIMGELRLRLKKAFDKEKIEIPWPHTKMYFGDAPLRIEYNSRGKDKKNIFTPDA